VADDHGVFLMEAMWMKFSPAIRRAIEIVRSGRIGEIRHLQAGLGYPVPPDGPPRFWDAALGGGALFDMGVYQIALARQLFGDPQSVTVTGDMRPDGVDLHETYTFEFETGATAQLITSITSFIPPRAWLGGTRGTLDPDVRRPAASGSPGTPQPTPPGTVVAEFPRPPGDCQQEWAVRRCRADAKGPTPLGPALFRSQDSAWVVTGQAPAAILRIMTSDSSVGTVGKYSSPMGPW
jgi:predicted dehydrogenase